MKNRNIDWLSEKEQQYHMIHQPFSQWLTAMEKKYPVSSGKSEPVSVTAVKTNSNKPKIPLTSPQKHKGFTPDKNYVQNLLKNLKPLLENPKSNIQTELKKCQNSFEKLLQEEDFEDADDIMADVHTAIQKYIYGSDTKVDEIEWQMLTDYLRKAGYQPVPVKAGDNIKNYISMFSRPIEASGNGIPGTIKHIQLMPYQIVYWNGTEDIPIYLYGKCSFYPVK